MEELLVFTKSFSLVYFFIMFLCICFWMFRKKNRDKLETYRDIPLKEE